jgi:o-succinylbenzoate synthase
MKITDVTVRNFGGTLAASAGNARRTWGERRGFLLALTDDEGNRGIGEASPLEGYSPDSAAWCEESLRALRPDQFPEIDTDAPLREQVVACQNGLGPNNPAACFAVETAILDLAGKRLGKRPSELLRPGGERPPVPLSAMAPPGGAAEVLDFAAAAWERGIRALKVKGGADGRFDEETELLRALRERFGDELEIRFDVNGAWGVDESVEKLAALAPTAPRYVEQPTPPYLLLKLAVVGELPVPIAADETMQLPGAAERLSLVPDCRVFVLKPMVLGGIIPSLRLARVARAQKKEVTVSHLLDGPVALAAAAELVHALPHPPLPCGLDRHAGLSAWPEAKIADLGEHEIRFAGGAGLAVDPPPDRA